MWITFKSSVNTNTKKRIMISVVYAPPIDSSYNGIKQNIFDNIELEYRKCANNYDIFLCGDFNARKYIYIWNVSRTDQYKISLRRDECNNIIDQLILNANTDRSSDYICSLIHKLITTASSGILKKININKNKSSMKQMPTNAWFDSECNELRETINTYAKRSNLTHIENNNYYHNLCNNYKRMIQRKKRNYNTNLKVNLEEMCSNNPKDYWGFWKRLQR